MGQGSSSSGHEDTSSNEEPSTWESACEGAKQGWDEFWDDPSETDPIA